MPNHLTFEDVEFLAQKHGADTADIAVMLMIFAASGIPKKLETARTLRAIADMMEMGIKGIRKEAV